ncbi:MAG: hypothetical protein WA823_00055 [Candidatus Acidiferrales bacterium]
MSASAPTSARIARIDLVIFAMIVFAPAVLVVGLSLAHSRHEIASQIALYACLPAFLMLPLVTAVHIIRNRTRSSRSLLWIESVIVGVLVALVTQVLALNRFGDTAAACVSLATGAAFALLPFFFRPRS